MVDLAEIQAAYYMVAATGVIVAAVYYVLNIRATQRNLKQTLETRQTQLFMDLYEVFRNKEFQRDVATIYNIWQWKDYDEFEVKYGRTTHPDEYSSYLSVVNYFGGLGVLVKRGMIDPSLVKDLMSGVVTRFWEKIEKLTLETRVRRSWPKYDDDVEYLYNVMKSYPQ
jgi:hypothetical protein